jgi:hypothetical protein
MEAIGGLIGVILTLAYRGLIVAGVLKYLST